MTQIVLVYDEMVIVKYTTLTIIHVCVCV